MADAQTGKPSDAEIAEARAKVREVLNAIATSQKVGALGSHATSALWKFQTLEATHDALVKERDALKAQLEKATDPAYIEQALEKSAIVSGTVILDASVIQVLTDARKYVADGIVSTLGCREEYPGFKEKSDRHLAMLESLRDRLDSALSKNGSAS